MVVLSDATLRERLESLVSNEARPELARACAYLLRPERVFSGPEAGESTYRPVHLRGDQGYSVRPGEIVWVRTRETIRVPVDHCAIWSQTHRYASRGLMLINASFVEPGYEGPLTGALVNFGQVPRTILHDEPFARVVFATLDQPASAPFTERPSIADYDARLTRQMEDAPRSFLNFDAIGEALKRSAGAEIDALVAAARGTLEAQSDRLAKEVETTAKRAWWGLGVSTGVVLAVLVAAASPIGALVAQQWNLRKTADGAVRELLDQRLNLQQRIEALEQRLQSRRPDVEPAPGSSLERPADDP